MPISKSFLKRGIVAAVVVASLFTQASSQDIDIRGTVTDNSTPAKPIASAVVKLLKTNLTTITDADGKFVFAAGTRINTFSQVRLSSESIKIVRSGFFVMANKNQIAQISIYNASGKMVYKQSQSMNIGSNFIVRPLLSNGIYIISAIMAHGKFSERFIYTDAGIATSTVSDASIQSISGNVQASLEALFSDTLLITASSYDPVKRAVTKLIESGITIKLQKSQNSPCGQEPCDPKANSKVRNLLCYLKNNAYISGQTDVGDADWVKRITGRTPAILGCDGYGYTSQVEWANSRKGILHYQWHWACPRGGDYKANCDFVQDLDNPNSQLWKDIDRMLTSMKAIGKAGHPVLFRPLHESNDNFMWWAKKGPDAYKKLYRLIRQRADALDVHNLIWDFNGMADPKNYRKPMSDFYPGDEYVDIISSDYYWTAADLERLKQIGNKNKVYGISETFNPLIPDKDPRFSYSIGWASRDWGGSSNFESRWKAAMGNSKTISAENLPDMTKW
jgi:hypothetical protein